MDIPVISQRFSYVKYDEQAANLQEKFKKAFTEIEALAETLPNGREKSLLLTYLEIAYMWTGKVIRDDQIVRTNAPYEAQRSNQ